jgi:hypothetical protein
MKTSSEPDCGWKHFANYLATSNAVPISATAKGSRDRATSPRSHSRLREQCSRCSDRGRGTKQRQREPCGYSNIESRLQAESRGTRSQVITTIYCAEIDAAREPEAETLTQESAIDLSDAGRELLSIYQGQNRVLPTDVGQ